MGKSTWRIFGLSYLAFVIALTACGGGGGGGGSSSDGSTPIASCENAAGGWETEEWISQTQVSPTCPNRKDAWVYHIYQSGCDVTISPAGSNAELKGKANGNQLTFSGSFPKDGGTLTINSATLTLAPDKIHFSGSDSFRWTDGVSTCSGTTTITGTRTTMPLYVDKNGSGAVNSSSFGGHGCGMSSDICIYYFRIGEQVTLTATPASGYTLSSWTGCDQTSGNSCTVRLDQPKTVTANFAVIQPGTTHLLKVNKEGAGTVTSTPAGVNCGTDCEEPFSVGAQVTLTATPESNYTFSSWTGCDQTSGNSCIVTMNQDKTVIAKFVPFTGTKQLGTITTDYGNAVAVDSSGNVYVAGDTNGNLDGNINAGITDIFLIKYNSAGIKQWTRLLGTSTSELGEAVAVDGSGNVYVTGYTYGNLDGNTNAGDTDIFLVKYDSAGTKQWTRLLGTASQDQGWGVAADSSGNVYVTGYTNGNLDGNTNAGNSDIFLVKYNSAGTKQWTRLLGTASQDQGWGVAADSSGNVYVTGQTGGSLDGNTSAGGLDVFLAKYNSAGVKQWTRQLGTTGNESGFGVAVDSSGNAFVTGYTTLVLLGKQMDILLVKYDSAGTEQWRRQLGAEFIESGVGIAVDSSGNAFVTGYTNAGLDGNTGAGGYDIFLVKYNTSGAKQWTRQLGTAADDEGIGVALDGSGNAYVTGFTKGGLDGNINAGLSDIFLVKYNSDGVKQ